MNKYQIKRVVTQTEYVTIYAESEQDITDDPSSVIETKIVVEDVHEQDIETIELVEANTHPE